MKDLKIKLIVGFRRDQEKTISAEEAHKAYYLFLNPSERGVFDNGLALRGADIQEIEPDYNATMGWNPAHNLDADDWNELRNLGIERKIRSMLVAGKTVAALPDAERPDMSLTLSEIVHRNPQLAPKTMEVYHGMRHIGESMKGKGSPQLPAGKTTGTKK